MSTKKTTRRGRLFFFHSAADGAAGGLQRFGVQFIAVSVCTSYLTAKLFKLEK